MLHGADGNNLDEAEQYPSLASSSGIQIYPQLDVRRAQVTGASTVSRAVGPHVKRLSERPLEGWDAHTLEGGHDPSAIHPLDAIPMRSLKPANSTPDYFFPQWHSRQTAHPMAIPEDAARRSRRGTPSGPRPRGLSLLRSTKEPQSGGGGIADALVTPEREMSTEEKVAALQREIQAQVGWVISRRVGCGVAAVFLRASKR